MFMYSCDAGFVFNNVSFNSKILSDNEEMSKIKGLEAVSLIKNIRLKIRYTNNIVIRLIINERLFIIEYKEIYKLEFLYFLVFIFKPYLFKRNKIKHR